MFRRPPRTNRQYIYIYMFPKLASANGVLTVLYKGPCLWGGIRHAVHHHISIQKCIHNDTYPQKHLVKVTNKKNFCKKGCIYQYKMTLPSLRGLLKPWLPWLPLGSLLGASWEPLGSIWGASGEPPEALVALAASWEPPGSLWGASGEPLGSLLRASWELPRTSV